MKRIRPMVSLRLAMSLVPLMALFRWFIYVLPAGARAAKKAQSAIPRGDRRRHGDPASRLPLGRPAPVLDGKLDDPCWQKGAVIDHFASYWTKTPRAGTFAYLVWDDDALYYAASMVDAELRSFGTKRNDTLWEGDVFELFFKPSDLKPEYFEFQANPRELVFEMAFPRRGGDPLAFKTAPPLGSKAVVASRGNTRSTRRSRPRLERRGPHPLVGFRRRRRQAEGGRRVVLRTVPI